MIYSISEDEMKKLISDFNLPEDLGEMLDRYMLK